MKFYRNILPSLYTKKSENIPFASIICKFAKKEGIEIKANSEVLEKIEIENLKKINNKNKYIYTEDLLTLWATLDMRKYLDAYFELTINPYLGDVPIKDLDFYPMLPSKYLNLLDIKLIDKFKIEKIPFKKIFIATYEIKDKENKIYRPVVEFYQKDKEGKFNKIGYGYDTDNNKKVELFIDNFNYAVYLLPTGVISLPLKKKKTKLDIYDICTDKTVNKMINQNAYEEDLEIPKSLKYLANQKNEN